jgi:hypothetical protein
MMITLNLKSDRVMFKRNMLEDGHDFSTIMRLFHTLRSRSARNTLSEQCFANFQKGTLQNVKL